MRAIRVWVRMRAKVRREQTAGFAKERERRRQFRADLGSTQVEDAVAVSLFKRGPNPGSDRRRRQVRVGAGLDTNRPVEPDRRFETRGLREVVRSLRQ